MIFLIFFFCYFLLLCILILVFVYLIISYNLKRILFLVVVVWIVTIDVPTSLAMFLIWFLFSGRVHAQFIFHWITPSRRIHFFIFFNWFDFTDGAAMCTNFVLQRTTTNKNKRFSCNVNVVCVRRATIFKKFILNVLCMWSSIFRLVWQRCGNDGKCTMAMWHVWSMPRQYNRRNQVEPGRIKNKNKTTQIQSD